MLEAVDGGAVIRYDRNTLISIGLQVSHLLPTLTPDPSWPSEILRRPGAKRRARGKRAGVRNRLRTRPHCAPLPSVLLANVQGLEKQLDDLRARVTFWRDIRDCNLLCFTQTWLNPAVPDHTIQPAQFFLVYRMDGHHAGTSRCTGGVCLMVNSNYCDSENLVPLTRSCTPNLELLTIQCHPFYLPREFTSVIASAVYIPPHADTDAALRELRDAVLQLQGHHQKAALIVMGDFNSTRLKHALPGFHQHITCPAGGPGLHCYTPIEDCYKAQSSLPLGTSEHAAIFLMPRYKERLLQEAPGQREVSCWTEQSLGAFRGTLDDGDWDMFWCSSDNIEM